MASLRSEGYNVDLISRSSASVYRRPPRNDKTKCNVDPASTFISDAVLSSGLGEIAVEAQDELQK